MLGSSWHWNSPRFYLRQENSPMNGALTTLKWMLMIIQLFTMAHLFLDGFPGLPIKFSSSPWAPKTWARIHLLWPVQVGSTHFFTWHRKISQCEFWKLLIQKKVLFTYMFAARKSESAISPWWNLVKAPNEALAVWTIRPQPAPSANSLLRSASGKWSGIARFCWETPWVLLPKADHFGVLLPMDKSVNQDLVEELTCFFKEKVKMKNNRSLG